MKAPVAASLAPSAIAVGDHLSPIVLEVTYGRVATLVAATWDPFPGHHDPAFAKAQGQKDIYLNTMMLSGFVDRVALEWSGPTWFLRRRAMRMLGSVYPGDVLTGTGTVKTVSANPDGTVDVVVGVTGSTAAGPCITAEITLRHGEGTSA
jgi:acyl dehydratase